MRRTTLMTGGHRRTGFVGWRPWVGGGGSRARRQVCASLVRRASGVRGNVGAVLAGVAVDVDRPAGTAARARRMTRPRVTAAAVAPVRAMAAGAAAEGAVTSAAPRE